MTIFAVIALNQGSIPSLNAQLATKYPSNYFAASPSVWFVAAGGTAKEVSDRLGISEAIPGVVVLSVSGYYGRASNNLWEWLAAKMAAPLPSV
jgi:hypothetical protein